MSVSGGSSLAGLISGSGLGDLLGGAAGTYENSVLTYPQVLTSRDVLERTLARPYGSARSGGTQTVLDALHAGGGSPRARLYDGLKRLRDAMSITSDIRSGIITIAIVTNDSLVSTFIAQALLDELGSFNVESHRSQGKATREFLEQRLAEADSELASAEAALTAFRNSNLRIGNSPTLQLELERLQRRVELRADLQRLLAKQFEVARIEERRDTPTFTVIQAPAVPLRKYRPLVLINAAIAAMAGVAIMFGWGYLKSLLRSTATGGA
jgi:uncharacterized protein involved in exopolysaccharide biosynthesis